jgi:hypothetical protein
MARRKLNELRPSTISNYRSLARKLWLKSVDGSASQTELLELSELEKLLGVKASEIRGPGRPPKYCDIAL